MKAVLGDRVIATAEEDDLVRIEGNWYFPPASVDWASLEESPTPYTCPWKGVCQYYSLTGGANDIAWSYPEPYEGAAERVGKDFAGYVAFDPRVTVSA
ncbi:DUF427 domain-containing protein [Labedella endophytica]|jgi:uncharacterized protein (DUF427 family)|uniref:DUF427 domain-containing protein n=1 Tax=Labedella endophytica TaxID=1523160 RepID=A0A433JWK7_9MICO|nr:DUF427 domain-containing protein [Labedella endophytica]RUR03596.1 DUF427 domain-containing protein [Labedella endophytica]